ncbi:rieske [2Fe-2S] domain protein [Klebsiella pneumoniae subsp. rhinoscleromatis ATCC 13884]|uniref:2-chlorobenzoate 1,2-dioxygenase, alpha subunit n=9 Tax=Klebsiella pneumoniae complex TaxID=3390273 RepID=A0A377X2A4_KLEPN|nr:rieske [2Fe-2S] domain protein [Klebsiella pneumoniae subsp. rhinoscleromatis ATCC 13884]STT66375.1 2-chlorobenzoate 1,2-dioxygenase, alpha subunit [Klebsiella pneumoniae]STV51110.1 2-chlorobenzoate 1,2-dioxygenase, alpha subunit [Klebsiella pneumoniae subsp. rhinoscleromatis]STT73075.1 2-chlorobenzoate 1,2-dioxygenase, alpha subunit [Klebsiella pneumoniae]STU49444.1 2-chlorobenzoate 1,2-dioxygenase, alpha subunit [Klebsiella pneumoniae]
MSNVFVQQPAIQKLLRDSAGLDVAGGDERFKAIIHRLLENICTLIDDYNVTEEEFWHAVNYLHELGGRQEAALLAAGLGLEHFLDLRQDAIDAAAHRETGTPRTIEGPLYVANAPLAEVDRENHIYRCHRSIFTDQQLFDFEMKHIFEGNWVFLAHESQIPQPGDYYTLTLGRQPVIITRDKKNELHALINSCAHRGAMLCRRKTGNKNSFTCPFHGWTFSNNGKLLKAKDESTGGYPPSFKQDGSHDLQKLPRFQSYRGFLFGSLNADVQPLEAYLGETCKIIDLIVDQAPEGLEVLKGSSSYVYEGNWKLGAENGADGYHVSVVHWNYASTMSRRNYEAEGTHAVDANGWSKSLGGGYGFDNGHMLLWTRALNPEVRPVYAHRERLQAEFGERRADQMVNETRNLCLYPNVYLMDQFSTQIRVIRPIAVDKTEVTIWCFAPKGESD